MNIHRGWRITATTLRAHIRQRYGIELQELVFNPALRGHGYRLSETSLHIGYPYAANLDQAPPVGPISSPEVQLQQPVLFGLIAHLFNPKAHDTWTETLPDSLTEAEARAVARLGQVYAEAQEVAEHPFERITLNSFTATDLLLRAHKNRTIEDQAETLTLHIYARLAGGVAVDSSKRRALPTARQALEESLGDNLAGQAVSIVDDLLALTEPDAGAMVDLGKRWVAVVEALPEDQDSWDAASDWVSSFAAAIQDRSTTEVEALQLAYPPVTLSKPAKLAPASPEEWVNNLKPPQPPNQPEEHDGDAEDDEQELSFANGIPESRWINYRDPSVEERRHSAQLAETLRTLRYRTPRQEKTPSQVPSGRLNTRELVQMTAQRTQGTAITANPWSRSSAITRELPGLTCALALDTSLSMGPYRQAILSVNWAFAHAAAAIGGEVSTWGFGGDSFEIIRAATKPKQVPVVVDSGAASTGSALALAHAAKDCGLARREGARLAIVLTDGQLDHHGDAEKKQLDEVFGTLADQGVTTLFIRIGSVGLPYEFDNARMLDCGGNPADIIAMIEREIITVYAAQ